MDRRTFLRTTATTTLAIGLSGLTACTEPAQNKSKTKMTRPNILFCLADDASYPFMSAYGCKWIKTPGFDRVAKEGILFTRAYTPNAKCGPSRSCILTGRNSWQLDEAGNHMAYFPAKFKTYAEALDENGWHVGCTGKGWAPGEPGESNGQKRNLSGKPWQGKTCTPPATGIANEDYAANFEDFFKACPKDKPFCFWYGGYEPHRGYQFKSGITEGGKNINQIDRVPSFWPDNETVRTDMLDYAYELEYFDTHLQRMLKTLQDAGQLDNTLVIVTADNGMPFPRVKGQEYEFSNHLPLAIMWKNGLKNPGRVVDDIVSFIDFAPTYFELAGIDPGKVGMSSITGKSLTDILFSDKSGVVNPGRNRVLIGKERHDVGRPDDVGYPIRGIVKGNMLYVKNFAIDRWPAGNPETGYLNCDSSPTKTECLKARKNPDSYPYWKMSFGHRPEEELYQIDTDPDCVNNLAEKPEFKAVKEKLRKQMFDELKAQDDPRMFGKGDVFDKYPYSDNAKRDFYNRYTQGEKINAGWVDKSDFEKEIIKE